MVTNISRSEIISNIRVGIPMLGDKNWPAGVNYVESLIKAVISLPMDERPQMFLVVHDFYLHAIDLYKSLFPLLDGLVFVGNNPDLTKGKLLNKVFHCTSDLELTSVIDFYYPVNSNVLPGVCSASWIPDFQHIHLPELFAQWELQSRDDRYKKIAELAKLVVFSSKDAEKDFRMLFPNSNAVTRVLSFFSQIPDECYTINPVLIQKKYALPDDFFICPNHFWIHKNHMLLFEALASLHQTGEKVHLVCTGPLSDHRAPEYISQLQRLISDLGIKDYVHILGVIPRMEQIQLLRRALAVIQPSLFEGWSTVVEDARALGKTIILSDLAVHYEQAPRYSKYFDRQSTKALINALEEILPDLKPGPDINREREATKEQEHLITKFARTFCDIALEGVRLFHEPVTNQNIDPIPNKEVDVSIILATKNRAHLLDEMLTSLKKASEGVRYEVIVIEGNSTDNTQEILQKHGVEQIYSEKEYFGEGKHSWAQLYNFGFSKARGKWAMYASDDIVFHESCIARAIEILSQQHLEIAGGIFFYRNIAAEPAWKDFGIDFTYGQKLLMNYGLIRLDNFREVNGLDEHYNFYCADGDLCYKLYEKGKEFIPLIGCFVSHVNISDSTRQINYSKADEDIQDYKKRWKHFVTTDVEPDPRRLMWDEVVELFKKEQEKRQTDTTGISHHIQKPRHSQTTFLDQLKEKGLWSEGNPLRLHLGCGEQHLEGYINIDYPPSEHNVMKVMADIHADITKLEFPQDSVDEIRLHHVFEHFNRVIALVQLIKWHQWLKRGGKLWIETPDLIGSAKTLLSDVPWRVKTGVVRHLTGDQASAWAYHIDQWFPERFEHTLRKLGFDTVQTQSVSWQKEPYLSNVHAIAQKTYERSPEELLGAAEEILWESTVADTEKPTYEVWKSQLREMLMRGSEHLHQGFEPPNIDEMTKSAKVLKHSASNLPLHEIHNFNQDNRNRWVQAKAKTVPPKSRVLDIGAGTCPYRPVFAHCEYKTHDFKKYTGEKLGGTTQYGTIDYESDITDIPVPDSTFDVILCTEVLEHVPEPFEAVKEMVRILKPGGRLLLTAPLGAGLHQMPFHYYGGFTSEWYKLAAEKYHLQIAEITPNGGFFKLLAQECARVAWTFDRHKHLHGENAQEILHLFNELLPRYLFDLDEKCFMDQFTVGYNVEMVKPIASISEEAQLRDRLQKNFRDVSSLICLAEIEISRSNMKKADNYLIAAIALEPNNTAAKALWEKRQQ